MKEKTSKLIFNPGIARNLLREGCQIIDIKKSKDNEFATVFVFKKDEHFDKAMTTISKQIQDKEAE
jgi:hypothetical protein